MTMATNTYVTQDDIGGMVLRHAISLCGQREQVRRGLKVQVNNLTRSVAERKKLYADLRAEEDRLTAEIEQVLPHLDAEDRRQLLEKYDPAKEPA